MKLWKFYARLGEWALPFFVRYFSDGYLTYFGVHVLCFSIVYERWYE